MNFLQRLYHSKKIKPSTKDYIKNNASTEQIFPPTLEHTLENFKDCIDLVYRTLPEINVSLVYFGHLVGVKNSPVILTPL